MHSISSQFHTAHPSNILISALDNATSNSFYLFYCHYHVMYNFLHNCVTPVSILFILLRTAQHKKIVKIHTVSNYQ